ncbi:MULTISPECIES: hypothetical protein [unclassified Bradyrhizobium]|uniref:hypothetical protein n=1 Tax=unclassified Bradyrhizobium TaxID=2631580 RepID=UPI002FF14E0F
MREKPKLGYFPFPLLAWLDIVADLDAEHERALMRLVIRYCVKGFLPNDDNALAAIVGVRPRVWLRMRQRLAIKFPQDGWRWPEIDTRIADAQKISGIRSELGKVGRTKQLLPKHGFSLPSKARRN